MTNSPQPIPSSIGRAIDLSVPSNRNIVIFSALVTMFTGGYHLLSGDDLQHIVSRAVAEGIFTFLAWALGRELDPDHNRTATIASGLTAVAAFILPPQYLLSAGVVLTTLRILSRSTGIAPTLLDSLVLTIGTGVTVALDGFWGIGLIVAVMFMWDANLPPHPGYRSPLFAGVMLVVTISAAVMARVTFWQFSAEVPVIIGVVFVSGIYGALLRRPQAPVTSVGDMTGEPLQPRRVLAAQWLALIGGLLVFVTGGTAGLLALLPVWAAMIGLIARQLISMRAV
jgi:hypothetical protein